MQTHASQHFLDLVQGLATEIRGAQHFRFGLLDEIADVNDVVVLQAIGRTHRQFQLVHLLEQSGVEREFGHARTLVITTRLVEVDEDIELVLQNAGSKSNRIFRHHAAIGFNGHDELVIIEDLAFAGVFHAIADLLHRREQAVDRNEANRRIFGTVAIGRHIALAGAHGEFHTDFSALVQGADDEIGIEDLRVTRHRNIARAHRTRTLLAQGHALDGIGLHADGNRLDVQDDVGDIFAYTGDRGEFMQYTVNLHGGDGRTLQRRQQNATQGIAQGQAKATLKRLGDEGRDMAGIHTRLHIELGGLNQVLPVFLDHVGCPSCRRMRHIGPSTLTPYNR